MEFTGGLENLQIVDNYDGTRLKVTILFMLFCRSEHWDCFIQGRNGAALREQLNCFKTFQAVP